jgi:hypothetical protein
VAAFWLPLLACLLAGAPARSLAAAAPRQLATGIAAVELLDNRRILAQDFDGQFTVISLDGGGARPWHCDWDRTAAGWNKPSPEDTSLPNFAISPDGRLVALAYNVTATNGRPEPEQAYDLFQTAIVLCDPAGSQARCVALAEQTDGGPRLYFSQDSRLLVGPELDPVDPTPQDLRAWYAEMADEGKAPRPQVNAIETASGRRIALPALKDAAWLDKCPYSDDYFFDEMDEPVVHYGRLSGPRAGLTGAFRPADNEGFSKYDWVAPGTLLCWLKGRQVVVDMAGKPHRVKTGVWVGYTWLPDGRSFFSRDGGRTLELGSVDWLTGRVAHALSQPGLKAYAMPLNSEGWPERVDTWTPLPDSSGVLIREPGDGGLVFVQL